MTAAVERQTPVDRLVKIQKLVQALAHVGSDLSTLEHLVKELGYQQGVAHHAALIYRDALLRELGGAHPGEFDVPIAILGSEMSDYVDELLVRMDQLTGLGMLIEETIRRDGEYVNAA